MNREQNEPSKKHPLSASELNDSIRYRAYELYEQRGREDGHELEDWVRAEGEVLSSGGKARTA
ncbi:MAG TPA: DUF2934 domain-containing protein [Verrucomicrobiae bacterium]|nr:DUF2934 domain-containing protein [Verrucomicrobiae bacterium]